MVLKVLALCSLLCSLYAQEVIVSTEGGESVVFDVDGSKTLLAVSQDVSHHIGSEIATIEAPVEGAHEPWDFQMMNQGQSIGHPRVYDAEVTLEEFADVHYIVTSLANRSVAGLLFSKSKLESAGDRIDHLHPLRFLMTIFTNEELKVGLRHIRGKGWVWNHFFGGIKDSFTTEWNMGNVTEAQVEHFASVLNVDQDEIKAFVRCQNWDGLVECLIHSVKRQGDYNRYDC